MLLAIAVLLATACSTSAVSSAPSTGSVTVQRVRELLADPNLAPPARIAPEDAYCKTRCMLTHEPQVVERCTGWIVVLIQRGDDIVHECISRDQLSAALISRIQSDLSHDESHLRIPIAPLDGRRTEGETRDFIIQGGDESKPLTLFEHLLEREISTDGFVSYNNLNKDVELGLTGNHKLERRAAILPFQSRYGTAAILRRSSPIWDRAFAFPEFMSALSPPVANPFAGL